MSINKQKVAGRGCLFYGSVIGLVLFLFILAGSLVALHAVKRMVNEFTDTKPMAFPSAELSASDQTKLQDRDTAFQQAVRNNQAAPPLALSADEINALLANEPRLETLRKEVYVTIKGDRLGGLVSLPLEQAGLRMFKGRYLNGDATFDIGIRNGQLTLYVLSFTVRGKSLPAAYLDRIRSYNLASGLNKDPRASLALDHLQSIQVANGKLVITPKTD